MTGKRTLFKVQTADDDAMRKSVGNWEGFGNVSSTHEGYGTREIDNSNREAMGKGRGGHSG